MTEQNFDALLQSLLVIARDAGRVILDYYAEPIAADTKADGSPVTLADCAAEAVILPALARLTPTIPVVAEEAVAAGRMPAVAERFWLVDPLDGTKEFINRNGEFTVNIALIDQGAPCLGVVFAPVPELMYGGIVGRGAWCWRAEGGAAEPISARVAPEGDWTALGSRSHGGGTEEEALLARYPVTRRRASGSSLKFCEIARGGADIYVRCGPTHEWDTAAGHAVLAAAGGRVEDGQGALLAYGKPGFRNTAFIAFGRDYS